MAGSDEEKMMEVQRDRHGHTIKLGQFGQYRLGKHLRTYGGLVECFQAEQVKFERRVELHILRVSRKANPTLVDRFLAKVQDMASIDHPAVMPVMDVDTAGSRAFFTTPIRDAVPLREFVAEQGGKLGPKEAVAVAAELAEALARMHARGILHREISLDSVHWDRTAGAPYFAEFPLRPDGELVSVEEEAPLCLLAGQIWDERSDVFLLCCLVYQLLAGKLPVLDVPDLATGSRLEPVHRALRGLTLPEGFQSVLIVGLEHSEKQRYHSALDMAKDIEECRGNPSVPVVNPDEMDDESSIRQAIRRKKKKIEHQQKKLMADGSWRGAEGERRPPPTGAAATVVAVLMASFLFTLPIWIHRSRRAEEDRVRVRVVAEERAGAPAREEARASQQRLERAAMQANVRATSRRTFQSRWSTLLRWAGTPQARKAKVCTVSDLLKLKRRQAKGDPDARATLDRWLAQAQQAGGG